MSIERTRLKNAYAYLVSTGAVGSYADVADRMGISKAHVSHNIKGPRRVSEAFYDQFQKIFKIDLSKYNEAVAHIIKPVTKFEEQRFIFNTLVRHGLVLDEILKMTCGHDQQKIAEAYDRINAGVTKILDPVDGE